MKELANDDYLELLKATIKQNNWNIDLEDDNAQNDIHQDELWYDCCGIINDLAQLVLDEREKRKVFIIELKRDLRDAIKNLTNKSD